MINYFKIALLVSYWGYGDNICRQEEAFNICEPALRAFAVYRAVRYSTV